MFLTVLEYDRKPTGEMGQLGQQILKKRFESYNKVWLANVFDNSSNHHYYDDNDRLMSAYEQEAHLLNSANYFNDKVSFLICFCLPSS